MVAAYFVFFDSFYFVMVVCSSYVAPEKYFKDKTWEKVLKDNYPSIHFIWNS